MASAAASIGQKACRNVSTLLDAIKNQQATYNLSLSVYLQQLSKLKYLSLYVFSSLRINHERFLELL